MFEPKFEISSRLLNSVGRIEAAREIIGESLLSPVWERKLLNETMAKMAYFGLLVEGRKLKLVEVIRILDQDPQRDDLAEVVSQRAGVKLEPRLIQEVINFFNGLTFIRQQFRFESKGLGVELGEKELKQIQSLLAQKLVLAFELGMYRKKVQDSAYFSCPQPVEVPYQMAGLFSWLKRSKIEGVHPAIRAAIIYAEILRINPFVYANSRVAEVFGLFVLGLGGYFGRGFVSLNESFSKRSKEVMAKLANIERRGEFGEWIEFFAFCLAEQMDELKLKVKRLSGGYRESSLGQRVALSQRQIELMEGLSLKESLTMSEARKILDKVSDDTILRDLQDLTKKKLVFKKGKTKGARYLLKK